MAEPGPEPKSPDQELCAPPSPHSSNGKETLRHDAGEVGSSLIPTSVWIPSHHILAASPEERAPDLFLICKMKIVLGTFPIRLKDS